MARIEQITIKAIRKNVRTLLVRIWASSLLFLNSAEKTGKKAATIPPVIRIP